MKFFIILIGIGIQNFTLAQVINNIDFFADGKKL